MLLPLSECSKLTGLSRSGLLKAISRGRVTASRDERNGQWVIDSAELSRVFPTKSQGDTAPTPNNTESELIAEKLRSAESQIAQLRDERDYLRRRIDEDSEHIRRLSGLLTEVKKEPDTSAHIPTPPSKVPWPLYVIAASTVVAAGVAIWHALRGYGL